MAGGDSLSLLPNDLLRRVLHFAPAREGASTSALSKQWRGLWRSSGAVNLDTHVPEGVNYGYIFSQRDAFVSAARSALEAADSPVTRLTFRVDTGDGDGDTAERFLYYDLGWRRRSPDVVTELLSLPAACRVEELRLDAGYSGDHSHLVDREYLSSSHTGFGALSFLGLLSGTLSVLDVTGCADLNPSPGGVAFPRLASLRLSQSSVTIEHLQDFIDAAPALATLYIESVRLDANPPPEVVRLHFPGVTELLMDRCGWPREWRYLDGTTAVEIDAPRLRRFTYNGILRPLSLTSQAPDLARVHLHIFHDVYGRSRDEDARRDLETFWRCARSFSNAKELKLRVNMLEDIAVVGSANRAKLLCSFPNVERLQLEGMHRLKGKTAAVAVANLLSCCPVLRDIRINLTMVQPDSNTSSEQQRCFLEKKYRRDLEKSIHGFMNRKLEPLVSAAGDYDDGDARYDKLSDLPALSGQDFHCLQSCLCCVRLQFRPETNIFGLKSRSNFGLQLIKFFAENAAVLKEMHIDGGNGKMCEHINRKLERWVTTNLSEKRKTTFVVLPLGVKSRYRPW